MIYERPIQTGGRKRQTWLRNPYDSIRSYDGFGRQICVHDYEDGDSTTYTKPFVGRNPSTIRFHHGDIVQAVDRWLERIWTAIVYAPPISVGEWEKRFGSHESDGSDDCYLVFHIDHEGDLEKYGVCPDESKPEVRYVDTHDHIRSFDVFPMTLPVPESHKERLHEKLVEHIEVGGYSRRDADGRLIDEK